MADEAKWYVVHTFSGYEKKVQTDIEKSVENSPSVPKTHKQQVRNWLCGMIRELSSKGWNNIPDLTLNIDLPIQIPERSDIEKYITF